MSEFKLEDRSVLSGSIRFPLRGVWSADLTIDAETMPEGAVRLQISSGDASYTYHGFVRSGGVFELSAKVRVVGGAGGLGGRLEPRYYTDTTVRTVVQDLLRDAGESLSNDSGDDTLGVELPQWTRRSGRASDLLDHLTHSVGAGWRVLPDGSVWVGSETWPEAEAFDYQTVRESKVEGFAELAPGAFPDALRPGVTFSDRHVAYVEHSLRDKSTRSTVYFDETAGKGDLSSQLRVLIDQATERLRWFSVFPGRVSQQDDDSTLQVELDDATMPGLTRVPIRTFVPGASVRVAADARVHVLFEGGDPSKPVACLFDGDPSQLVELTITTADGATLKLAEGGNVEASPGDGSTVLLAGGGARVGRVGDSVRVTIPAGTFVTQVTGQAAGVLNPASVDVDGEIIEGAQETEA